MVIDNAFRIYTVMQHFQPTSDMIDAANHGGAINEGAVFQLAEEQHHQRQQQQEAQEQQLPQQQQPPLNYITQAEEVRESPAAANEEEAEESDVNYNPNSQSDEDEEDKQELDFDDDDVDAEELQALRDEGQAAKDVETKLDGDGEDDSSDPSATADATSNSGEDPPYASLFTLFLASLTVQRDVPNCPSFADHQQHSNPTEAMATQAAQQQQQQQQGKGLHVASHAEVPNSRRGTLVEHLQQAPPRVAVANSRQGIQQQPAQLNNLPFENYRYPNLHDSYTILFPMPTNEVYQHCLMQ